MYLYHHGLCLLTGKLFGNDRIKSLNKKISPTPLPIYCHRNDKGFLGDDLGLSEKFCNDFFVSPTDMGMCLTKNLNLDQVMKVNNEFEPFFESKEHSTKDIERGSKWSQLNFVFRYVAYN